MRLHATKGFFYCLNSIQIALFPKESWLKLWKPFLGFWDFI
ncbi:hypothetical protein BN424_3231 [Carnobacterium maltaromaticum LMA28]|uniref:Uncharacterized protein n=1 Tax=Carnobacterium maltaromaticum LMA28 TaxID=1234679 RepID=K8E701_CARML|nr:hypothetical protein BN424_3231 [Carnobacterium maltaromaticum LMA28]